MQRGANSPTADNQRGATGPPSKKQRLSNGSFNSSSRTETPAKSSPVSRFSDRQAVQAALAEEEKKRQQAVERAAADAGETRWALSFQEEPIDTKADGRTDNMALRIVQKGYAEIDWDNEPTSDYLHPVANRDNVDYKTRDTEGDADQIGGHDVPLREYGELVGRRSFGRFNKSVERRQDPNYESSSSSEASSTPSTGSEDSQDEGSERDSGDSDPTERLIRTGAAQQARAERQAKKKASKGEVHSQAKDLKSKNISLNRLSSISAGGGADPRKPPDLECFKCGKKGHKAKKCPNTKRVGNRGGSGTGAR